MPASYKLSKFYHISKYQASRSNGKSFSLSNRNYFWSKFEEPWELKCASLLKDNSINKARLCNQKDISRWVGIEVHIFWLKVKMPGWKTNQPQRSLIAQTSHFRHLIYTFETQFLFWLYSLMWENCLRTVLLCEGYVVLLVQYSICVLPFSSTKEYLWKNKELFSQKI